MYKNYDCQLEIFSNIPDRHPAFSFVFKTIFEILLLFFGLNFFFLTSIFYSATIKTIKQIIFFKK